MQLKRTKANRLVSWFWSFLTEETTPCHVNVKEMYSYIRFCAEQAQLSLKSVWLCAKWVDISGGLIQCNLTSKTKIGRKPGLTVRSITNWVLWWLFHTLFSKSIPSFHNFTRHLRTIRGLLNDTKWCIQGHSDKFLTLSMIPYMIRLVHCSLHADWTDSIIVSYISDFAREMCCCNPVIFRSSF